MRRSCGPCRSTTRTLRCLQETLCHYQGQPPSGSLSGQWRGRVLGGAEERVRELEAQ